MTKAEIIEQLTRNYGDAAMFALETSCVVEADYEQGYIHILDLILPALEEEMSANGSLDL